MQASSLYCFLILVYIQQIYAVRTKVEISAVNEVTVLAFAKNDIKGERELSTLRAYISTSTTKSGMCSADVVELWGPIFEADETGKDYNVVITDPRAGKLNGKTINKKNCVFDTSTKQLTCEYSADE